MTWGSNIFPLLQYYSTGTATGLFGYSPAPGIGTLVASQTESAKDPYGNFTVPGGFTVYNAGLGQAIVLNPQGLQVYTGSLAGGWTPATAAMSVVGAGAAFDFEGPVGLLDNTATPAPIAGLAQLSANPNTGHVQYVAAASPEDGQIYDTGKLHLTATGQTIAAAQSNVSITGLTATRLAVGTYRIRGKISWTQSVAATVQNIGLGGGLGTGAGTEFDWNHQQIAAATSGNWTSQTSFGFSTTPGFPAATIASYFDGTVAVATAGAFAVVVTTGAGGGLVVRAGSYCDIEPSG